MQANRPRNTAPEVALRSALHRAGLRFRKHARPVPGLRCEPDIVFPGVRLAVFLDGCWWHSCPLHGQIPKAHQEFWSTKLAKTQARDMRNTAALNQAGWTVVRIWEHEPMDVQVEAVRATLADLQGSQRGAHSVAQSKTAAEGLVT